MGWFYLGFHNHYPFAFTLWDPIQLYQINTRIDNKGLVFVNLEEGGNLEEGRPTTGTLPMHYLILAASILEIIPFTTSLLEKALLQSSRLGE